MILAAAHRRWTFRPSPAATLATALLLPLLLALGDWQLHRAAEKAALREQWSTREALPPLRLGAADLPYRDISALSGRRLLLYGRWQPGTQILLDNQVLDGQAGYRVFTALRIDAGGDAVLVDRGWVPADPRREVAPDIRLAARDVTAMGIAAPPPSPGPFARQEIDASLGAGLLRVQQVDPADLSRRLGLRLQPWTLRLDAAAPDGYRRQWPPPGGLTPTRHQAYAVQWFALAALLVFLYVKLNLHRA